VIYSNLEPDDAVSAVITATKKWDLMELLAWGADPS
jgi:hypothetical protein